jgi:hypothetical protein
MALRNRDREVLRLNLHLFHNPHSAASHKALLQISFEPDPRFVFGAFILRDINNILDAERVLDRLKVIRDGKNGQHFQPLKLVE